MLPHPLPPHLELPQLLACRLQPGMAKCTCRPSRKTPTPCTPHPAPRGVGAPVRLSGSAFPLPALPTDSFPEPQPQGTEALTGGLRTADLRINGLNSLGFYTYLLISFTKKMHYEVGL